MEYWAAGRCYCTVAIHIRRKKFLSYSFWGSSCLYRHKSLPCHFENMGRRRALVLLVSSGVFIELRYFSLGETTQQDGCGGLKKGRIASMTDSEFAICCSKPVLC